MSDPAARGLFPGRPGRTLRAAAVLAVFLALFIVLDRLSGPRRPTTPPRAASATTAAPAKRPTTTTVPATTARPTTTTAPATTTTGTTAPTTTTAPPLKSAQGVTVQILNGTGKLRVARDFKPQVRAAGYTIVNTANAVGDFPISTVYYTDGNLDDALSFKRRFPAFSRVAEAPSNLSSKVQLHLVIGANFDP